MFIENIRVSGKGIMESACAGICLSFDDGRGDLYEVYKKILQPLHVPFTVNVTTGYIDGTCPQKTTPTVKAAISREQLLEMAANPITAVAGHSDFHTNDPADAMRGKQKLLSWLSESPAEKLGFASPSLGLSVKEFSGAEWQGFAYLRTGFRISTHRRLRVIARKAGRLVHWPFLFRIAYRDTIMYDFSDRILYSVSVLKDTRLKEVRGLVDYCILQKGNLIFNFHSIKENMQGEDNWSWEWDKFLQFCVYLKEMESYGKIRIMHEKELIEPH